MNASEQIDGAIAALGDWRGEMYRRLRQIIGAASPELAEDWKWGTAVWIANGNVCAVGPTKDHVKINFFKGATLPDPDHLFNAGLDAKQSRAIDLYQGDTVPEAALQTLVRAAVEANRK
ncbi:MAG TPA: DUF1801 domain-containing protein [Chloroflexia bacterium]|nr:DUF1801 domain-containing protein [Chloroflexia bacterium]